MNKRIIFITGSTETLGYFSKQMASYMCELGIEVFLWDMERPSDSRDAFEALENKANSILFSFNFIGLCGESQFSYGLHNIWDEYDISKVCVIVDSPVYYYRQLTADIPNLHMVCIDRNHLEYLKKWFPKYSDSIFAPSCGNLPIDDLWYKPGILSSKDNEKVSNIITIKDYENKPLNKRHIDIAFIGNYVTVDSIMPSAQKAAPEYKDFLMSTAQGLINNPEKVLEVELFERLKEEFPDEEDDAYPEAMFHMIFIDLYVRTHFRSNMIKTLVENGYKIHLVGKDWDKLNTTKPENLIYTSKMMTSADCVRVINDSKFSLNIMPWFKDGAHDRIFSSMLARSVCITDSSKYLDECITPWVHYVPFILGNDDDLITNVDRIMADDELAESISENGRELAKNKFTWKNFTDIMLSFINDCVL